MIKKRYFYATIAGILLISSSYFAWAVVSGESLMNVQDSTISGSLISPRRVKDAGNIGDAQTSGILPTGLMNHNGTNWDKVKGDTTSGLWVNIKNATASPIPITGTKTPADTYTNPTDAVNSYSLSGLFNGTTWDRMRGDITNGLDVDITRLPYVAADNSTNSTTKLPVLSARANAATQTWTEGNQVPLSVDLSGNTRVLEQGSTNYTYLDTTTTAAFVNTAFGFTSKRILFTNDSANNITISFNTGTTTHFVFKAGETMTFDNLAKTQIAVKSVAGGDAFRMAAW